MVIQQYINLALDSLMNEPWVHLVLKHPVADEVVPPVTEAARNSSRIVLFSTKKLMATR